MGASSGEEWRFYGSPRPSYRMSLDFARLALGSFSLFLNSLGSLGAQIEFTCGPWGPLCPRWLVGQPACQLQHPSLLESMPAVFQ